MKKLLYCVVCKEFIILKKYTRGELLVAIIEMSHIISIIKVKKIVYTTLCMKKCETKVHYLLSDRYLLTWYDEIIEIGLYE